MPNQVGTRSTSGPFLINDAEGNEKVAKNRFGRDRRFYVNHSLDNLNRRRCCFQCNSSFTEGVFGAAAKC